MLDLATKKRVISANPASGLRPLKRDEIAAADKRLPFTPQQLAGFFRSAFYTAAAASGPTPYRYDSKGGWRFWLPLLSLFTGLRPRELLQLHVEEVRHTPNGTTYLDVVVSEQDNEGPVVRSLKNLTSRRRVPLHPVLIRIGFPSFVEERQTGSRDPRLFATLTPDKYGNPSWYPLKRFNETFLPKEMPDKGIRQTFYSFRHTFRDGLRAIGATPDVLLALGWSQGSRVVSDNYGSRLDPDQLFEHIRSITFPGLDLSHLYDKTLG